MLIRVQYTSFTFLLFHESNTKTEPSGNSRELKKHTEEKLLEPYFQ